MYVATYIHTFKRIHTSTYEHMHVFTHNFIHCIRGEQLPYSAKLWWGKMLANSNEFAQVLLRQIILQNFYKKRNYQWENIVCACVSLALVFGTMSILKYFRPTKEILELPRELPDPNGSLTV